MKRDQKWMMVVAASLDIVVRFCFFLHGKCVFRRNIKRTTTTTAKKRSQQLRRRFTDGTHRRHLFVSRQQKQRQKTTDEKKMSMFIYRFPMINEPSSGEDVEEIRWCMRCRPSLCWAFCFIFTAQEEQKPFTKRTASSDTLSAEYLRRTKVSSCYPTHQSQHLT